MFVIECPACGKNKTVVYTEDEGHCKRCQADLTALIRIRSAALRSWVKVIACLATGELKQAQATVKSISRLTSLSGDEPLVWLLQSVDIDSYQQEKPGTADRQTPDNRTAGESERRFLNFDV